MNVKEMRRKSVKWEQTVKALKLTTGAILVAVAGIILIHSVLHLLETLRSGNTTLAFETFFSDILLVIIVLEVAKTLFTYVENEEMYLHSIMEAAFIAVLRQVILIELHGPNWTDTLGLSALILAMGYVYYRLFRKEQV